jgi:NAD+ synthetase
MNAITSTLIQELHAFAKSNQYTRAVIGLSGGLDSAVALTIAVRAFGAKNVTALIMPEMGVSSPIETEHAKLIAQHFDCTVAYEPINNYLVDYQFVSWDREPAAFEHLKARIRATLLQDYAECTGSMIIGTANKSDLHLGVGIREGEFIGALHVLGDLYKTDVMDLARHIGLPVELIDEADSEGIWNKTDDILRQLEDKVDPDSMIEKGMDSVLVHKVVRLTQENEALVKSMRIIHVGRISEAIKKAQKAEAESIS